MATRDAAWWRDYRKRRKAKVNPHEACDARIAALEAGLRRAREEAIHRGWGSDPAIDELLGIGDELDDVLTTPPAT